MSRGKEKAVDACGRAFDEDKHSVNIVARMRRPSESNCKLVIDMIVDLCLTWAITGLALYVLGVGCDAWLDHHLTVHMVDSQDGLAPLWDGIQADRPNMMRVMINVPNDLTQTSEVQ
jgi:hypothetical protein